MGEKQGMTIYAACVGRSQDRSGKGQLIKKKGQKNRIRKGKEEEGVVAKKGAFFFKWQETTRGKQKNG